MESTHFSLTKTLDRPEYESFLSVKLDRFLLSLYFGVGLDRPKMLINCLEGNSGNGVS